MLWLRAIRILSGFFLARSDLQIPKTTKGVYKKPQSKCIHVGRNVKGRERWGERGIIFFSSEHEKATRVPNTERFVAEVDSFLLQRTIYVSTNKSNRRKIERKGRVSSTEREKDSQVSRSLPLSFFYPLCLL